VIDTTAAGRTAAELFDDLEADEVDGTVTDAAVIVHVDDGTDTGYLRARYSTGKAHAQLGLLAAAGTLAARDLLHDDE
jgi:hypothetical protein